MPSVTEQTYILNAECIPVFLFSDHIFILIYTLNCLVKRQFIFFDIQKDHDNQ